MKVELEITFSEEEIKAMCLKRCENIDTVVSGHFEAAGGYYGSREIICKFYPEVEDGTIEQPSLMYESPAVLAEVAGFKEA